MGIDKETWHRYRDERSWFYEVTTPGHWYHMSNINAAIGLAQLDKLDGFITRRRAIVGTYNKTSAGLSGIRPLYCDMTDDDVDRVVDAVQACSRIASTAP